jgi:hypothetical protein
MEWYIFASMMPSTRCNLPTPCAEKHPHTIIFLSCFRVARVTSGL